MNIKRCCKCGSCHPATTDYFHRCGIKRRSRDGFHNECKTCRAAEARRRNSLNGETRRQKSRDYYATHKEAESLRGKRKYQATKDKVLERSAKRFQERKNHIRLQRRARLQNNPMLRLNRNVGRVMNLCLHGNKGGVSWKRLVGYTSDDLKRHLESLFVEGMSWANYGRSSGARRWWTVDHRRPINSFSITDTSCDDFRQCWDLNNLQPMWSIKNFGKGARYDTRICGGGAIRRGR